MRGLLAAALLAAAAISAAVADARPAESAAPASQPGTVPARVSAAPAPAALVDPRAGGLSVGLGEWSVAPEVNAIRPGRVTFVVRNGGKVVHGLRIKEDSDRSGGDRFEERSIELRPGRTTRFTVTLPAGVYSIECFVEGHDDLGMERRFEVRANAPLVRPPRRGTAGSPRADIAGFAFKPATIRVKVGTTVRWTNRDQAPHTVTASSGDFTSKQLGRGGVYARRFGRAGTFAYLCALHPQMKGRVVVGR
jgi:plastocyanin